MKVVLQRVKNAYVEVDGNKISEILFPSTSTYAFFTLCKTTFINYNLTDDTRQ